MMNFSKLSLRASLLSTDCFICGWFSVNNYIKRQWCFHCQNVFFNNSFQVLRQPLGWLLYFMSKLSVSSMIIMWVVERLTAVGLLTVLVPVLHSFPDECFFMQSFLGNGCDSHRYRRHKSTTVHSLSLPIRIIRLESNYSIFISNFIIIIILTFHLVSRNVLSCFYQYQYHDENLSDCRKSVMIRFVCADWMFSGTEFRKSYRKWFMIGCRECINNMENL